MEQGPDQAGKDDVKGSVGGVSSLYFNLLDEEEAETVMETTEPAEDRTSTLEPPLAHKLPESCTSGKNEFTAKLLKRNLHAGEK